MVSPAGDADHEGIIRRSVDLLPENVPVTVLPMMPVGKSIELTDWLALDLVPIRREADDMDRDLRNPPGVHTPQAHYSHVAQVGQTLYISGQLAIDPSGRVVGVGDAAAQARQCYGNLATILAHYGGALRHLVKTTTYITHWGYRPLVAAARDEFFPAPPYPANTLVVVQGLAEPHFLVEIEGIAVLDQ